MYKLEYFSFYLVKRSVENLATSKITGGRRVPLKTRRKYDMDRFPNEAVLGEQVTVTRQVRANHTKTGLKTTNLVNLAIAGGKVKKTKILKVLEKDRKSTRLNSSH